MIDTTGGHAPSPAASSRRGWKIGAFAALVVAAAGLCVGVAWLVHQATTKHVSSRPLAGSVHLVVVDASAGDIHLVNGNGPVHLRSTARYLFSKPRVSTSIAGGVLRVRSKCGSWWLHDCSTNLHLTVPRGTAVDVHTEHGEITAEQLISRRVRADASGNVRLYLANDPSLIIARSDRSDVTIHLPRARYVVDANAAFHQTHIGVPRDDAAPRAIEATAKHGRVRIKATSTNAQP
jgi:hypothetical protein